MSLFTSCRKNDFNLAPNLGVALEKDLNTVESLFLNTNPDKSDEFSQGKNQMR